MIDDQLNRSIWTPAPKSKLRGFEIYADTAIQYQTSATDVPVMPLFTTPHELTKKGTISTATITYSVHMRARETRLNKLCHKEISPAVCLAKCTKSWMVDTCHCIPFSFYKGISISKPHLPYCTESMYLACNPESFKSAPREPCMKKCKDACEYTSYNWQVSHDVSIGDPDALTFELILQPIFTPFSEFTWTVKATPEQFLSQAGGLLNFYLGLSGLSIFTFVVSLIDVVKKYFYARKLRNMKKNEAVVAWEWKQQSFAVGNTGSGNFFDIEMGTGTAGNRSKIDDEKRILEKVDLKIAKLREEMEMELGKMKMRVQAYSIDNSI